VVAFLASLTLTLVQPAFCEDKQGAGSEVPPELEIVRRTTFRAWGSHGAFEPSLDAAFMYFGENGPDGLVVKRASLFDGSVVVVASTRKAASRLAAIPGEPTRLVLSWQIGIGAASPYGVSVLDMATQHELNLDVGADGGDGWLQVSPSGHFLATGTQIVSPFRSAGWYPSEIAVFSLASGKQEFGYKIPRHVEKFSVPEPTGEKATEAAAQVPARVQVAWKSGDVLALDDGLVFRRDRKGKWIKSKAAGQPVDQTGVFQNVRYPGDQLRFRYANGQELGLAPSALFGDRGRLFSAYNLPNHIGVAVREDKSSGGWSTVETVVLKWRSQ
jgi:hypothetical protein